MWYSIDYQLTINGMTKETEEFMECEICNKKTSDVSYRPNAYAQDVNNDSTAYHTVCDSCDHENIMDI